MGLSSRMVPVEAASPTRQDKSLEEELREYFSGLERDGAIYNPVLRAFVTTDGVLSFGLERAAVLAVGTELRADPTSTAVTEQAIKAVVNFALERATSPPSTSQVTTLPSLL